MPAGWVKIYREIIDKPLFKDANAFRLFIHLLLTVEYEEGRNVEAGQRVFSLRALSSETGMTVYAISIALKTLVESESIRIVSQGRKRGSANILEVVNWAKFQGESSNTNRHTNSNTNPNTKSELENVDFQNVELFDGIEVQTQNQTQTQTQTQTQNQAQISTDCRQEREIEKVRPKDKEIEKNQEITRTQIARAREDLHANVTPEMVIQAAVSQGCNWTIETATAFLSHYRSIGWKLPNGALITNWRARVKAFDNYGRNMAGKANAKGRTGQWDPKTIGRPEDFKEGFQRLE